MAIDFFTEQELECLREQLKNAHADARAEIKRRKEMSNNTRSNIKLTFEQPFATAPIFICKVDYDNKIETVATIVKMLADTNQYTYFANMYKIMYCKAFDDKSELINCLQTLVRNMYVPLIEVRYSEIL